MYIPPLRAHAIARKKHRTCESTHAETDESTLFVQTSGIILTGIAVTFVDVDFASGSGETALTVAIIGADGIDASPALLARRHG